MTPIADILSPLHVNLALSSSTQQEGVEEVLSQMNGDSRVADWKLFEAAVRARNAPAIACGDSGICIAHGRTDAVHSLVMAAGRSAAGLSSPDVSRPVRLVFVVGIPATIHSEYLRAVGAIARLCREDSLRSSLLTAQNTKQFVEILSRGETRL